MIAERMRELGIVLPPVFPPVGNYLGCVVDGDLVWVGGHGPEDGERRVTGKVGADLSLEQAREAARMTGLSILATLQAELGDLDRIERIVRVFGMVNCAPGFNQTPAVIDGCSDLLVELFGEAGRHTRAAVGIAELPFDIAVEIELVARIPGAERWSRPRCPAACQRRSTPRGRTRRLGQCSGMTPERRLPFPSLSARCVREDRSGRAARGRRRR